MSGRFALVQRSLRVRATDAKRIAESAALAERLFRESGKLALTLK